MHIQRLRRSCVASLILPAIILCAAAIAASAGTLGHVLAIGGQSSDLALDEDRGVLYIANLTANRIDVMSLRDLTVQRSMNVAAQPAGIALSTDRRHLVVTHYGNFAAPASIGNSVSVIDLQTGARQVFALNSPPLGVAFGLDNRALIVTSKELLSFNPSDGTSSLIMTISGLVATLLPQPQGTLPPDIIRASLNVSGDGAIIYGVTDAFQFRYDSRTGVVSGGNYASAPALGPRAVSVNQDGSAWIAGWVLYDGSFRLTSQFPNVTGELETGSVAFDSHRNLIYCQLGEVGADSPTLIVADADNLTIRERYHLAENLSGRSVFSSDGNTVYALSESGVTVLPMGSLNETPRIQADSGQVLFRGSTCDRGMATHEITLAGDGLPADYAITSPDPAVRISHRSGVTPAVIGITVDMAAFLPRKGTSTVRLKVASAQAVNVIPDILVQINTKEPDQRGAMVPLPGKLVDIAADPVRNRVYVLRQDANQVLVFDSTNFTQVATLRTNNTPKSMTITSDRRYLLVGCDNSQLINVYDLDKLQADTPIRISDYPQSIAASANAILVATRSSGQGPNAIHRVDMARRQATRLPTLGVFENKIQTDTVLTASGNGRSILIAQSDGNVLLYNAPQDAFVVSRKLNPALTGAYAASSTDRFLIGNTLLNASLVPTRRFESESGTTAGFSFLDDASGFRFTGTAASAPGILQRVNVTNATGLRPVRTAEAPLLDAADSVFTRTLAVLPGTNAIVALTASGLTVFPWDYDAPTTPPRIDRLTSLADGAASFSPGGLISAFGVNLGPVALAADRTGPLPTVLADSCLTVNGEPVPLFLVSPDRVNAQLPLSAAGVATVTMRTPDGVSDPVDIAILPGAPAIFRVPLDDTGIEVSAVYRHVNGLPATLSNPVRRNEFLTILVTGLGPTNPAVAAGAPAPDDPAAVISVPAVSIGGVPTEVVSATLMPGQIGVYQIVTRTNGRIPTGMVVPLQVQQGSSVSSTAVRVVD